VLAAAAERIARGYLGANPNLRIPNR